MEGGKREMQMKAKATGNLNGKYYQIPSKSQLPNPKIGSIGVWDLFGSIGIYWSLGFPIGALNRKLYIPPLSIEKA